ncbi:MAG: peptidoglycan DD-metalloendopeptidase family protein, partial [Pseudomonadota bacterium]
DDRTLVAGSRMKHGAAALFCLLVGVTDVAAAGFPEIDRARRHLQEAETALTRASGPKAQLAALGAAVSAQEAALSAFHSGLRAIALEDQALTVGLDQDRAHMADYLGALQTISRAPKSALLVFPDGPTRAARAGMMLAEIVPALDRRMSGLRAKLDALRDLRALQEAARIETRGALAGLQDLRLRTKRALKGRDDPASGVEFRTQAEAARNRAQDLDQLAAVLETSAAATSPATDFGEPSGDLPLPVTGRLVAGFGAAEVERQRFGIVVQAPAYAQVTTPADATVRYAGPLVGFGQVVVLEPAADWLIVISGLDAVDRVVGETVLAGEKIGDLGGPLPTSEEFLMDMTNQDDQISPETVYIEMRRRDKPIDPAPWFALDG